MVLIDCLTLLVSNLLVGQGEEEISTEVAEKQVSVELESLLDCYQEMQSHLIVVSNEVGMGLVPPYPVGRFYRDLLGKVNQTLAQQADQVYLLVAGLPIELKVLQAIGVED